MPTSPKDFHALLWLEEVNGTLEWQMNMLGVGKTGPNGHPTADVPQKRPGSFTFIIAGKNTNGVTFANEPIFSEEVSTTPACPAEGEKCDQISVQAGQGSDKVLVFHDANSGDPATIAYQLNFDGADPLDPIIENGGGTGNVTFFSSTSVLAFSLGAIVTLAGLYVAGLIQI